MLGSMTGESWHGNARHCPVLGDAGLPPLLLQLACWVMNALSVLEMLVHSIPGKYAGCVRDNDPPVSSWLAFLCCDADVHQ